MIDTYYTVLPHKGKITLTTVGSPKGDSLFEAGGAVGESFIPAGYAHRPDLISNLFFGDASQWWILLGMNGISDPFEGLNVGDRINLGNG